MSRNWIAIGALLLISMVNCGGRGGAPPPPACVNSSVIACTQSGAVRGVIEGSVRAFRGIPYAAPPIGNLRWKPPAPPAMWNGIRDASSFGNVCPQLRGNQTIGDEDCLVLNVFGSAQNIPAAPQPVMVFFHGGGDIQGSTQQNQFDSPPLATHGVIVVTVEYRLGALGFFVHPLLTAEGGGSSGNYGLMDQLAALSWVQNDIAAFGGDPMRVMAFGQSAGGADVQVLLASPAAVGLFSRAGIESDGIALNFTKSISAAEADQAPLVGLVGCNTAVDVLACLRTLPASVLVTNQAAVPTEFVIENRVLPRDPFAALQASGSPVPLLLGANREESTFINDDPAQPLTAAQYAAKVHTEFDSYGVNVSKTILSLYPVTDYDAPVWALVAVDSDVNVVCEVRNTSQAALGKFPVWRYLFTHRVENDPNLNLLRAFHREELFFLFGHLEDLGSPYTPSEDEDQLSSMIMSYWTNFAATGDPNSSGLFQWPEYSSADTILQLDVSPMLITAYHKPQCDYLTPTVINQIIVTGP